MRLQPGVAAREDAAAGSEKAENRDTLKYLEYVYCNVLFSSGLSFGHFSGNHRLVALQEFWVFWKFPLSFEKILKFLDNFWENIGN